MTEFAHSVNFTLSFGCTVLPDDINRLRKSLQENEEKFWKQYEKEQK